MENNVKDIMWEGGVNSAEFLVMLGTLVKIIP
jgi:hypothetical protein